MASPAEQLAKILRDAISGALQDNKDLFDKTINVTGSGGGQQSGGGSGDLVGLILGLAALGLAGDIAAMPIASALDAAQSAGGSDGLSFSVGYFVASTLLQFAEPYTRQLSHEIENAAQSQILEPDMAAEFAARGIISADFGQSEAAGGGFDKPHFNWMLEAAYNYPAVGQLLQLWNRGYITESNVNKLLTLNGVAPEWQAPIKQLSRELLTPADLALAVLRQNITMDQGVAGAAMFGLNVDDFQTLIGNTGEPLGLMQLLEAYRRDFIDEQTLDKGILESRVRDEWIPVAKQLRYFPMSTAEAANAVTRGYLTNDQGASIAQQNGLEPEHWQYVYESNGRPPSHEQLATLFYRGKIDLATFEQGIRESDIKDKYIADVVDLGVKLLPLFEGVSLLKNGDITGKTFATQMLDQGYQPDVINEIVAAYGPGKVSTVKHLTAAEITEMYSTGIFDGTEATNHLEAIGFTADDATSILTVADLKAKAKLIGQQVAHIETQFYRNALDEQLARQELKQLNLADAQVEKLISLWKITRPLKSRNLTEAQILHLVRQGVISKPDALPRLEADGLTEDDAKLLLAGIK